jgi:hypothetical protein
MILTGFLAGRHARMRRLVPSAAIAFEPQAEAFEGASGTSATHARSS